MTMLSIHTAVNRETKGGAVLGPDQRISTLEAVRAYTSYAALFSHSETWRGTIEPGKVADFVIPSEDILEAPPGGSRASPSPRPSWTTGSCTGSFPRPCRRFICNYLKPLKTTFFVA